jgi:mevalonate kinase
MRATVSVRVPGKVMLSGEYSVLDGGRALATTVDLHMAVRVRPKPGAGGVWIASDLWDEPRLVTPAGPLPGDVYSDAVRRGMTLFGVSDLEIRVDSELDIRYGLGSSSALRLGVLLAMEAMARIQRDAPRESPRDEQWLTAREAYRLQKEAQGAASGYDVATQLVGGLVVFESAPSGTGDSPWPGRVQVLDTTRQQGLARLVHVFVGGRGSPTGALVQSTREWLAQDRRLETLRRLNQDLETHLLEALLDPRDSASQRALLAATRAQRLFFAHSPEYPADLAQALEATSGCDEAWSFKTTGAGGQDAILLLGLPEALTAPITALKELGWSRLAAGFETAGTRIARGDTPHG